MSQFLDTRKQLAILKEQPEEFGGLLFYPVTMEHYSLFRDCELALTLRQSTLPATYAVKNFAQALYALDIDALLKTGEATGIWSRFVIAICLALRIPIQNVGKFVRQITDPERPNELKAIIVTQHTEDSERVVRLTPQQLTQVRTIIARQNGSQLPDESENPELVQAEQDIADYQKSKLIPSIETMVAAVAANQHVRLSDVYSWTIYEFEQTKSAIERDRGYLVYNAGEMSGMVKFKNGNPYPSIFFDKKRESSAVVSVDSLKSRLGDAVQTVDALPDLQSH